MKHFVAGLPFLAAAALTGLAVPSELGAGPLDQWEVSCGADKGAVTRQSGPWMFRTSSNHCPGGVFKQRAEIESGQISASHKGAYLFRANIAVRTNSTENFDIFQIHDGRIGCAPPLKVTVLGTGQKLEVLIRFDGTGAFDTVVILDNIPQISGRYEPGSQPQAFRPTNYYFKHGVYSRRVFDYVMTSRDMTVSRVRVAD